MMEKSINIFKDIDELALFFAAELLRRIQDKPKGKFFSIALSGGSTPKVIFRFLALHFKDKINWDKVQIFWGDERCVSPLDDESNYLMAKKNLLDKVPIPAGNIFRIKGEVEPVAEAIRYSDIVREHVCSQNNAPQFDLTILGLGEDGHTASIFPGSLNLFSSNKLFEVAEHPLSKQKRISATGKLINNSKIIAFLAIGESKSAMVSNILDRKEGWEKLPASLVHPQYGALFWLLDENAASKLLNH